MKKSLVAVLLSLVALTLVAGAAFAGGASFDVTVKVTIDGEASDPVAVKGATSPDTFKAEKGLTLSTDVMSSTKIEKAVKSKIGFALSEDKAVSLDVFVANGEKLGEKVTTPAEIAVASATDYFLVVKSGDVSYAIKASVTVSKTEKKYTEAKLEKSPDEAVKKAKELLGVDVADGTKYVLSADVLTEADITAINAEFANLLVTVFDIPTSGVEAIIFKITLSGIDANRLLTWLKLALNTASSPVASIAGSATEIEQVYYISDEGKQIMENNTTEKANQEVNVAFKVSSGKQAIAVKDGDPKTVNGGSPSGGCDMGLLSGLALFAVALLPLRKSR